MSGRSRNLLVHQEKRTAAPGGYTLRAVRGLERLPRQNPHLVFLDQLMMNRVDWDSVADRDAEIRGLTSYLNERIRSVDQLVRRLEWLEPKPAQEPPTGF